MFKSEESVELARIAATLFPSASFRVVMLIPTARARFFLTNLYREVIEVITREVAEAIVEELKSLGVRIEGIDAVKGRAPSAIESYVKSVGGSVLATSIAMELGPEDVDHSPVTQVIGGIGIPTLLHTPLSRVFRRVERVALAVGAYGAPSTGLEIVEYLSRLFDIEIEVLGIEEGVDEARLATYASSVGARARALGEVVGERVRVLEEATASADLIIVDRSTLEPPRGVRSRRRRLSVVERVLVAISRAPIIFAP